MAPKDDDIRTKEVTENSVTLIFPSERVRVAFWVAFTDYAWPVRNQRTEPAYASTFPAILRGDGPLGGLEVKLPRHKFFDDAEQVRKIAAMLSKQGILLEVAFEV